MAGLQNGRAGPIWEEEEEGEEEKEEEEEGGGEGE